MYVFDKEMKGLVEEVKIPQVRHDWDKQHWSDNIKWD
jgi:hypothetical protein